MIAWIFSIWSISLVPGNRGNRLTTCTRGRVAQGCLACTVRLDEQPDGVREAGCVPAGRVRREGHLLGCLLACRPQMLSCHNASRGLLARTQGTVGCVCMRTCHHRLHSAAFSKQKAAPLWTNAKAKAQSAVRPGTEGVAAVTAWLRCPTPYMSTVESAVQQGDVSPQSK